MRYKVIRAMAGTIALWVAVMGGTIAVDFDRVQQSNQVTAELEWTFIGDAIRGNYAEVDVIDGGENFIGRSRDAIENTIIDEKGRVLSDTYDSLEPLGDGYVRFENTPAGAVIKDEDGKNRSTGIGVLDDEGNELSEEEALTILEKSVDSSENDAEAGTEHTDTAGKVQTGEYRVMAGDRKYVGVKDRAGTWVIPPVFNEIAVSADGKYAVIRNGANIGIAVLGD